MSALAVAILLASPAAAPPPNAEIPHDPSKLVPRIVRTVRDLDLAVDDWRRGGTGARPPDGVTLNALYEQRVVLLLAQRRGLAGSTLPRLPLAVRRELSMDVAAKRDLLRLTPVSRRRRFRTGPALPARTLLGYYRAAQHRFGVAWNLLAAVNFVESSFNKLRSDSAAGAQGPMQFIPSTWRAYGLGGNVHDPHDAILGAANYLRSNGAPNDNRRALYRYNPSPLYVDAILRYARRIRTDRRAFYECYAQQVFVRTPAGLRRLTGPP